MCVTKLNTLHTHARTDTHTKMYQNCGGEQLLWLALEVLLCFHAEFYFLKLLVAHSLSEQEGVMKTVASKE